MNDFINKISLYDFLAILIPGGCLLFELFCFLCISQPCFCYCHCYSCCSCFNCDINWIDGVALTVIAYMLGCIYQVVVDWWWTPFRNNPTTIAFVLNQIPTDRKIWLEKLFRDQIITGMGCCCLLSCSCLLIRMFAMGLKILISPLCKLFSCLCCTQDTIENNKMLDGYYQAYYFCEKYRPNNPYNFIEGQIALCRNMILPVILAPYTIIKWLPSCLNEKSYFHVLAVLLFVFVYVRQEKLYSCVLEDYEYVKHLENEQKH